jgi:hypothetical protein
MLDNVADMAIRAGLFCDGTPDSFDEQAINLFTQYVVGECLSIIESNKEYAQNKRWPATELADVCTFEIERTFGVK